MNFADGTVAEKRDIVQWEQSGRMGPEPAPVQMEVRERDYFWTPGFMFYAIWVGLGFAALLHFLLIKYGNRVKKYLPVLLVLIAATPVIPLTQNMGIRTRAGNWVAFDYGYNLLMSCDKDAILFTNGDNDTFPLWALQEAYGIRKDVRVVNLSLLNTDWYIEQLFDNKPKLNVPTVLFDETFRPHLVSKEDFVKRINHQRNSLKEPLKARVSQWNLEVEIPPMQKSSFFRIQDYMIINIVHGNAGYRPINFAVTVSDNNYMGLAPYLIMDGLVYRLMPTQQNQRIDVGSTLYKLDNIYRFTNLGSKDLYLNDETERLLSIYAACFFGYVYEERAELQKLRDLEKALVKEIADLGAVTRTDPVKIADKNTLLAETRVKIETTFANIKRQLDRCVSILPKDWRGRMLSAQIFAGDERFELAEGVLKNGAILTPNEYMIQVNLGFLYRDMNKHDDALVHLEKAVNEMDSDFRKLKYRETVGAISALLEIYRSQGNKEKLKGLLTKWVEANPGDRQSQQELMGL
jgi:tetratricopeptide (TPR) repeat protein